jgi:N-acetylglucosaminyl-diphospho-decaprenol L-rhamnosyltransferase
LSEGPKLTVAIVSFNTRDLLERCLETLLSSLAETPELEARVVVVDNASPDGSAAMVRERFPSVDLRALDRNLGFAGGNNLVLREATTPYVLLLNPDTEVRADAPRALVRFLDAHPAAGAVGGRLIYPDGSFQHAAFAFPTLPMSFLDFFPINHRLTESRLNGRYPRDRYDRPFQIDHPLGACFLVRRTALAEVGLFDEGYYMYAEEVDLCWRIKRAGWQIWFTPEATVVHHAGAATRQFRGEMLVQLHRSRFRFFERHYPRYFGPLARGVVAVGVLRDVARAALDRIGGAIGDAEWRQRREVYARLLAL